MIVHIVSWDHREQPDIEEIDRHVRQITADYGRVVRIQSVEDTGCDQYAITIADRELTVAEQQEAWAKWWEGDRD